MPFINIQVTKKKNGTEAPWFKDSAGRRVGTSQTIRAGSAGSASWVTAEQLQFLAGYYIELQQEQLDKGIGSNGAPMPPLKTQGKRTFVSRSNGVAQFRTQGRARTLYGTGKDGGHMRDDIRINYVDERMAKISITTAKGRIKALANERKAPWWGLSPASVRLFAAMQAQVFGGAVEDYLDRLGLVDAGDYIVKLARVINAKRRALGRLAA